MSSILASYPFLSAALALLCLAGLASGTSRAAWQQPVLYTLGLLGLLASGLYYGIDQLTGGGLNESVFYHLEQDTEGAGIGEFLPLTLRMVALLLAGVVLAHLALYLGRRRQAPAALVWPALAAGIAALALHPLATDLRTMAATEHVVGGELAEWYVPPPEELQLGGNPPNLVVLYLESLEQGYFDPARFPGVISHIDRWAEGAEQYTNLRQVWGTAWTIAGMTASQCGIPLVTTGSMGNSMHSTKRFLPGAACLGDVLTASGYRTAYVGGAKMDFAGKGTFYATHGITDQTGLDEILTMVDDSPAVHKWGVHDELSMAVLRDKFDQLASGDQPFALFGLTLDTHHPVGHISPACVEQFPASLGNEMMDSVRCTDWLVSRVLEHIARSPAADNTIVVLASDHLAMPNVATDLLEQQPRRNFLAIKAPGREPVVNNSPGTTMDTAALLLNLLDPSVQAMGLGRNLRGEASVSANSKLGSRPLRAYEQELRRFWLLPGRLEDVVVRNGMLFAGPNTYELPVGIEVDQDGGIAGLHYPYRKRTPIIAIMDGMRGIILDHCVRTVIPSRLEVAREDWCISIADPDSNTSLAAPLPKRGQVAFTRGWQGLLAGELELGLAPARPNNVGTFWSQGGWTRRSGFFANTARLQNLHAGLGLTLYRVDPATELPTLLNHVDTCTLGSQPLEPVPAMRDLIAADNHPEHLYVVVAHDSIMCEGSNLAPQALGGLGLDLSQLTYRKPYIAALSGTGERVWEESNIREGHVRVSPGYLLEHWRQAIARQQALPESLASLRLRDGELLGAAESRRRPLAVTIADDGAVTGILGRPDGIKPSFLHLDQHRGLAIDRCLHTAVQGRFNLSPDAWCVLLHDPDQGISLAAPLPANGDLDFPGGWSGLLADRPGLGLAPANINRHGHFLSQGGPARRSGWFPADPGEPPLTADTGLTLYAVDPATGNTSRIDHVDTCSLGAEPDPVVPLLAKRIGAANQPGHLYVVLGHDSVFCEGTNVAPQVLAGLDLATQDIDYRGSYIGVVTGTGERIWEQTGKREGRTAIGVSQLLGLWQTLRGDRAVAELAR